MKLLHNTRLLPGAVCTMLLRDLGAPESNYSKGVLAKYARQVSQADDGAVTGA